MSPEEKDYRIMLTAMKNKGYSVLIFEEGSEGILVRGWDWLRRAMERAWEKQASPSRPLLKIVT